MPDCERRHMNRSDLWVFAFLLLLVVIAFRGVILGTHDPFLNSIGDFEPWQSNLTSSDTTRPESFATDPVTQTWAWAEYSKENIRNGDFPLWNTRMYSGTPFVANRLTGLYNPLILIPLYLLPTVSALSFFYFIHYLLAAWFMYLFLKSLGLSRPAATFGAVAYIFQGAYIPWMGWIVSDKAYLPMTLYYLQRICDRGDRVGLFGYIISFLLLSISSYPQMTAFAVYIGSAWVLFTRGSGTKPAIGRLVGLAWILVITFLLGAIQHLPMAEFFRNTLRALPEFAWERTDPSNLELFDSPFSLLAIIFPRLWGDYLSYPSSPLPLSVLQVYNHAYIGILSASGFLFAPLVWKNRYARFFIVLSLIGLLFIAWPQFYLFVYKFLPGFRISGMKPAFLTFTCMIIVSGFVLDLLIKKLQSDRQLIKNFHIGYLSCVITFLVLFVLFFIGRKTPGSFLTQDDGRYTSIFFQLILLWIAGTFLYFYSKKKIPIGTTVAALFLILLFDLIPYHEHFTPLIPKGRTCFSTSSIEFLQQKQAQDGPFRIFRDRFFVLMPNTPMLYGLDEISGFDSFVSADYGLFFGEIDSGMLRNTRHIDMPLNYETYNSPMWDFLNVRYLISPGPMPLLPEPWEPALVGEVHIYENPDWLPRWFLVDRVIPVGTRDEGYEAAMGIDPAIEAVIVEPDLAAIPVELLTGSDGQPGTLELIKYGPDELRLQADCTETSFLVFSDTFFPGWRAWVDDEEVKIYRTDGVVKGVVVPEGNHSIRFVYDPVSYKIGWLLFLIGLVVLPFSIRSILRLFSFVSQETKRSSQ